MAKNLDKWLNNAGGSELIETPTGLVNGSNADFVITQDPKSGSLKVYLDGLLDLDFTYDGPSKTITMNTAPELGQTIKAVYNK